MRLRTVPGFICLALVALIASSAAGADSTPSGNQATALKRAATSWITYAVRGNAPEACRLQVEPNVGGTPCNQLPTYFVVVYCPETSSDRDDSPWRTEAQLVGKTEIKGDRGFVLYRAASKKSKLTAKARFTKVGGKWRIASIQSRGQRLNPAGLIFTDGQELRKELWPAHC
jgi:hypothetical protein